MLLFALASAMLSKAPYSCNGVPKSIRKSSLCGEHLCAEPQLKLVYLWVLVWVVEANAEEVLEKVVGEIGNGHELELLILGWAAIWLAALQHGDRVIHQVEGRVQKLQGLCIQHIEQLLRIIPERAPGCLVNFVEGPERPGGAAQIPWLCQEVAAPVDLPVLEVEFQGCLTLVQQELCLLNDPLRYLVLIECYDILAVIVAN